MAAQGPFLSLSEPQADSANKATLESLAATTKGSTVAHLSLSAGQTLEALGRNMGEAPFRSQQGCVLLLQPSRPHTSSTTGLVSIWPKGSRRPTFSTLERGRQGSNLDFSNLENPNSLATTHVQSQFLHLPPEECSQSQYPISSSSRHVCSSDDVSTPREKVATCPT